MLVNKHCPRVVMSALLMVCVTAAAMTFSAQAAADSVPSHGEMAAAIRSANLPCGHVLKIEPTADNQWRVQCNSGNFHVSRDAEGKFSVSEAG